MKRIILMMTVLAAVLSAAAMARAEDQPSQQPASEQLQVPLLGSQDRPAGGDPTAAGVVMVGRPSAATQEFPKVQSATAAANSVGSGEGYIVGVNDILEISVLEPEELLRLVRVAPDGTITFPYIGTVMIKGLNIPQIQEKIHDELSDGYLKYPVVQVALKESNSKLYMVYGEVNRPGSYQLEEYSTVMRAISVAGGFTKFGNSSRVKVLRPRLNMPGYDTIKIDINKVMGGDSAEDVQLKAGDMVVVSEGVF